MFQASDSRGIYALFRQRSVRPSAPTGAEPGQIRIIQAPRRMWANRSAIRHAHRKGFDRGLGFITVLSARDVGLAKAVKRSGWPSAACASHKLDQPASALGLPVRGVFLPAVPTTRCHRASLRCRQGSGRWDRGCRGNMRRQRSGFPKPESDGGSLWLL